MATIEQVRALAERVRENCRIMGGPAPWHDVEPDRRVVDNHGDEVALVHYHDERALIVMLRSAAPELAESVIELLDELDGRIERAKEALGGGR